MKTKKILVTGATGFQGGAVVKELVRAGYEVSALLRSQGKSNWLREQGVRIEIGSFADKGSLTEAFEKVDALSLVFPLLFDRETLLSYTQNVIEAAKSARLKLLVFNTSIPTPADKVGLLAIDLKVEIRDLLLNSGLPVIILQPPIYLDNIAADWSLPLILNNKILPYPVPSGRKIAWLSHSDLARYTLAALEAPHLARQTINIGGEPLTGEELAKNLSEKLGDSIQFIPVKPRDFETQLKPVFGELAARELANIYRFVESSQEKFNGFALDQMPGIKPQPFAEWARTIEWRLKADPAEQAL